MSLYTIKEIYKKYEVLNTPYQNGENIDIQELHAEVKRHIDDIGNSNPHWNKLNEIELVLNNWYPF